MLLKNSVKERFDNYCQSIKRNLSEIFSGRRRDARAPEKELQITIFPFQFNKFSQNSTSGEFEEDSKNENNNKKNNSVEGFEASKM